MINLSDIKFPEVGGQKYSVQCFSNSAMAGYLTFGDREGYYDHVDGCEYADNDDHDYSSSIVQCGCPYFEPDNRKMILARKSKLVVVSAVGRYPSVGKFMLHFNGVNVYKRYSFEMGGHPSISQCPKDFDFSFDVGTEVQVESGGGTKQSVVSLCFEIDD